MVKGEGDGAREKVTNVLSRNGYGCLGLWCCYSRCRCCRRRCSCCRRCRSYQCRKLLSLQMLAIAALSTWCVPSAWMLSLLSLLLRIGDWDGCCRCCSPWMRSHHDVIPSTWLYARHGYTLGMVVMDERYSCASLSIVLPYSATSRTCTPTSYTYTEPKYQSVTRVSLQLLLNSTRDSDQKANIIVDDRSPVPRAPEHLLNASLETRLRAPCRSALQRVEKHRSASHAAHLHPSYRA